MNSGCQNAGWEGKAWEQVLRAHFQSVLWRTGVTASEGGRKREKKTVTEWFCVLLLLNPYFCWCLSASSAACGRGRADILVLDCNCEVCSKCTGTLLLTFAQHSPTPAGEWWALREAQTYCFHQNLLTSAHPHHSDNIVTSCCLPETSGFIGKLHLLWECLHSTFSLIDE